VLGVVFQGSMNQVPGITDAGGNTFARAAMPLTVPHEPTRTPHAAHRMICYGPAVSYLFPSSTITFDAALRDLAGGSPKARAMAAHALGDVTEPVERQRAVDALLRALDDDRPEVRAEACSSLGELDEPSAVVPLVKRLADGAAPVRQNAAIALGTIGHADAFEPLAEALRDGPADLRFQAATSLAEVDPRRAFEPVLVALGDRDPQVVGAAALAAGAIARELDELPLRTRALEALGAALETTPASAAKKPAPNARFDIAYALADLGDARGRSVLADALADPDRAWDAVSALAQIHARPELERAIESKHTPHEAAVLAAGKLVALDGEHAAARAVLLDALTARKVNVRGIAVEQLGENGGAWAVAPLEKLARSGKGSELLETIATALRQLAERTP
jgi:HEAT repeat protein